MYANRNTPSQLQPAEEVVLRVIVSLVNDEEGFDAGESLGGFDEAVNVPAVDGTDVAQKLYHSQVVGVVSLYDLPGLEEAPVGYVGYEFLSKGRTEALGVRHAVKRQQDLFEPASGDELLIGVGYILLAAQEELVVAGLVVRVDYRAQRPVPRLVPARGFYKGRVQKVRHAHASGGQSQ